MKGEHRFAARVMPGAQRFLVVEVPEAVSEAFGRRGPVPVTGTVDGESYTTTLTPAGGGRHQMYVNSTLRKAIDKGDGDVVEVVLRYDVNRQ